LTLTVGQFCSALKGIDSNDIVKEISLYFQQQQEQNTGQLLHNSRYGYVCRVLSYLSIPDDVDQMKKMKKRNSKDN